LLAAEKEATVLLQLRAKALILLLYDTGLRTSEVCQSKWKDIYCQTIDGDIAYVLRLIGAKTGKTREVVLNQKIGQVSLNIGRS
jgi:site-specific recombinase XerD